MHISLQSYASTYSLSRSWIHERPNASIASGIQTYNPAIEGFYFYEMYKGNLNETGSSVSTILQPTFISQINLAATFATICTATSALMMKRGPQIV